MGLFDYFEPDPAIDCPNPSCRGHLAGWQGKHSAGMALLHWKQNCLAPTHEGASEESRASAERLATFRLGKDEEIDIYGGECPICGFVFWNSRWELVAIVKNHLWSQSLFRPHPEAAVDLREGWVACPSCFDSWPRIEGKRLYLCGTCERLLEYRDSTNEAPTP